MKFGQLIEYNMRDIFQNAVNAVEKLVPSTFLKN